MTAIAVKPTKRAPIIGLFGPFTAIGASPAQAHGRETILNIRKFWLEVHSSFWFLPTLTTAVMCFDHLTGVTA